MSIIWPLEYYPIIPWLQNDTIIPPSAIVLKQLGPYCQVNITREDLVILREEKQRNDGRNIIITIALLFLQLLSQLFSLLFSQLFSPPFSQSFLPPLLQIFSPEPLESKIPAKHLDYKQKALDLSNLTEPEPNT
jgi:hypothetical protein